MRIKNKFFITMLLAVLAISAVSFGLNIYNNTLKGDLAASVYETLTEVTAQQKFNFTTKISSDIDTVKNLALMAGTLTKGREETAKFLDALVKHTSFEYLSVANTSGQALLNDGTMINISSDDYYINAMNGKTGICNPQKSQIRDVVVVPVSTPIYSEGEIAGVLIGTYTAENLSDLFLSSFGGKGFVYVTDSKGDILVEPKNDYAQITNKNSEANLYDGLAGAKAIKGYETKEEIQNKLSQNKSGYTKISIDGNIEFLCYSSIGVNDWQIFTFVPEEYIATNANLITGKAAVFAIVIVLFFTFFLIYLLFMQRKGMKEREQHTKQLEQLAYYDEVTGLPNLTKFKTDVQNIVAKNPDKSFIIAKLDIVNFKMINEIFGFETGDKVVIAVAKYIRLVKQEMGLDVDALTRVNADEFMLMDVLGSGVDDLAKRINLFEEVFNQHIGTLLGSHRIEFRYSVYFLDAGETDIRSAIEKTNIAHHIAKSQKNKKICFYDDLFKKRIIRDTEIENQMEAALEKSEFQVYLQPKYDLDGENVVGAETLVRWITTDGRTIFPNEFIPLFERNGYIVKLDFYMFERTCEIIRGWIDEGKPVVAVSVNFSRAHLADDRFVSRLEEIADRYDVPKKYLEIELTESTILDNEELLDELLNNLHNIGFTLSMDDFGIGYSSLGLLKNLPVDVIKIDRSFFVNNRYKSKAKIVIESVINMAKKLKITTVAEGVESKDHIDLLREVGCDVVQGYYYAKPMPAKDFHNNSRSFVSHDEEPDEPTFDLSLLGDINTGRMSLGAEMPVSVYRLFQFTIRSALNHIYGEGESLEVFRASGELAGKAFAKEYLDLTASFDGFIAELQSSLRDLKIGVLELEEMNVETGTMVITVKDDLDCSGTPNLAKTLCQYDEGFISGILYEYTKKAYIVREVDCWGTGADVCRFHVKPR